MNLIEDIKASLLALKKDYPFGIYDNQVLVAFNYNEEDSDLEFLNNVITKGFKFNSNQFQVGGTAGIVINFGEDLKDKFRGDVLTLNVANLKEISASPDLKKQLWVEIQKILKMI